MRRFRNILVIVNRATISPQIYMSFMPGPFEYESTFRWQETNITPSK